MTRRCHSRRWIISWAVITAEIPEVAPTRRIEVAASME